MPDTVTSRSREKVRPITAASWATDLAGPSPSSRASSDPWSVLGISRSISGRRQDPGIGGADQEARLQHGPLDLLHEQGDAAGRGHDAVDDRFGQAPALGQHVRRAPGRRRRRAGRAPAS